MNIYASYCAAATYSDGFTIFSVSDVDDNFNGLTDMLEKISLAS